MGEPERVADAQDLPVREGRPERRRSRRRSSSHGDSTRPARSRLRALYFSLAALWGFLAGTGAVLVGLSSMGRPVDLGGPGLAFVSVAAVASLAGGVVVAAAYRAASRRYR
jgi:hypothetical protein